MCVSEPRVLSLRASMPRGFQGPPEKNEDGKYMCDTCDRQFDTISALGGHRRFCDQGTWQCAWCECKHETGISKGPGPDGAKTLCSACSSRWRSGRQVN